MSDNSGQYNLREIYNLLILGKTIEIPFASAALANNFRIGLANLKTREDKLLVDCGFMLPDARHVLSFLIRAEPNLDMFDNDSTETVIATVKFIPKKEQKRYQVVIIDDGQEGR